MEPKKKPEEKPKDQPQGRSQIKFVRETRNAIRVVRHPSEQLYVEASTANDGRVTLLDEPYEGEVQTVEPIVEGILEDISDSDSDEARQEQPQNGSQEGVDEMPYGLNNDVVTYQLEDKE